MVLKEMMKRELCTIDELLFMVQGKYVHKPEHPSPIHSVAIDSRKVTPLSLFIPLKGDHTDGHRFLKQAVDGGARTLFIAEWFWLQWKEKVCEDVPLDHVSVIVVPDPLKALQDFSKSYLSQFNSLYRIGITGSNGKTTTKEIVGSLLHQAGETIINKGNFNSEIGLPLSVLRVREHHRFGVFEMGMNHEGEMDILSDIVRPDTAIITNIGTAHIGLLGSKDAIAREKKKICAHFDGRQMVLLYENEVYYSFLSNGIKGKIVPYGQKSTRGFTGYKDLGLDGMTINWEGFRIHYPLFGIHNLNNALGALSLGQELGMNSREIIIGLESVEPLFGRSQVFKGKVTILLDCYNSNPDSAREVLSFLCSIQWKGQKSAVLGSMLELGGESEKAHEGILHYALSRDLDNLFLFGAEFRKAYTSFKKRTSNTSNTNVYWTENMVSLIEEMKNRINKGDLILLKGSRGVALERLLPELQKV